MSETMRQATARLFSIGDRVRMGGEWATVKAVNVHAAAVVSVQLDGAYNVIPALFTDLKNPRREATARTAAGTGTYWGERWNCLNPDRYAGDRHKYPPIRVRPPEDDRLWLLAYASQTGRAVNAILAEALTEYRGTHRETDGKEEITVTENTVDSEDGVKAEDAELEDGEELWARYGDDAEEMRDQLSS